MCSYSLRMPSSLSPTAFRSGSLCACLASSSSTDMYISMRYEDRQCCAFMSFKCCLSSLAAASLAGWASKVRTLPSILFWTVVMCALHLAIFLEICGAVAFLHSLLMSAIVVSDKFADAILVFCLRGNWLRLRYLRCFCNVFKCAYMDVFYLCLLLVLSICYLQISVRMRHVTFADSYLSEYARTHAQAHTLTATCYMHADPS